METKTKLGHNRTGIQMAPVEAAVMIEGSKNLQVPAAAERGDLKATTPAGRCSSHWPARSGTAGSRTTSKSPARQEAQHLVHIRALVERLTSQDASMTGIGATGEGSVPPVA